MANTKKKFSESKFPESKLTVDMVVFGVNGGAVKVLLAKRGKSKYQAGKWSIPGGYVSIKDGEIPEEAVNRELREKTGINAKKCFVEQLRTFASPIRDPRGFTATIAHLVIVPSDMTGGIEPHEDDTLEWVHLKNPENSERWIGNLKWAFDHKKIVERGHTKLNLRILTEHKFQFTFLPAKFTQNGLREVFQYVKGHSLSRQALGKRFEKMVSNGIVVDTGASLNIGQGRPNKLYEVSEAVINELEED